MTTEKEKVLPIELYTIYLDGIPRALTLANGEERATYVFRQSNLGTKLEGVVTAMRSGDTPFEEFMRLSIEGLYMRMFQADAAAMAQQRPRH